jgi:hypothetical protein
MMNTNWLLSNFVSYAVLALLVASGCVGLAAVAVSGPAAGALGASPTGPGAPTLDLAGPAAQVSASPATLTVHGVVATETPNFWAVDVDGMTNAANSKAAALLNATPITTLRYGDNWVDETNWTTGCYYNGNSTCSPATGAPATFAALCQWLHDQCVLGLPAETNSVSATMSLVHWLAAQTSWQPTCWAIGNEPQDWTHFNIPWTHWRSTDNSVATAAQFALDSANMTQALRQIYPGACVIGIENNDNVGRTGPWTSAVVAADPAINAVAIHSYPDNHCLGPILSETNLTSLARQYQDAVAVAHGLPVYTHEFNVGLGACSALGTEAGSAFTSANIAQALEVGMPQFSYFQFYCSSTDCMVSSVTNAETPIYTLYSELLVHLDIAHIRNVTFSGGVNPETYAVQGSNNATDSSLLVSNAATSGWENLSLAGLTPSNWTGMVYAQNTLGQVTQMVYAPGMTLTLPPESTVVVSTHAAPSQPASGGGPPMTYTTQFAETGLPSLTTWTVTLNGVLATSSASTSTFNETNGTYLFQVGSVSGYGSVPGAGSLTVLGAPSVVAITFTLVPSGGHNGTGTPGPTPPSGTPNGTSPNPNQGGGGSSIGPTLLLWTGLTAGLGLGVMVLVRVRE